MVCVTCGVLARCPGFRVLPAVRCCGTSVSAHRKALCHITDSCVLLMFIGPCIIVIHHFIPPQRTLHMIRSTRRPSEMNNVEDPIPSDQSLNNQIDMGKNELIRRTSTRNKKAPCTMSKDFLWYSQMFLDLRYQLIHNIQ